MILNQIKQFTKKMLKIGGVIHMTVYHKNVPILKHKQKNIDRDTN